MLRIALIILALISPTATIGESFQERSDWGRFFTDESVNGTIVVIDERAKAFGYKTSRAPKLNIGRYVGWVEWSEGPVFFSLNIDLQKDEDHPRRVEIARTILHYQRRPSRSNAPELA